MVRKAGGGGLGGDGVHTDGKTDVQSSGEVSAYSLSLTYTASTTATTTAGGGGGDGSSVGDWWHAHKDSGGTTSTGFAEVSTDTTSTAAAAAAATTTTAATTTAAAAGEVYVGTTYGDAGYGADTAIQCNPLSVCSLPLTPCDTDWYAKMIGTRLVLA